MDPVTTALLSAAAAGATTAASETVKQSVCDAYNGLKGLLQRKFGPGSDVVEAVAKLESKPDSKARRAAVAEEVASAKVDSDAEVLAAAEVLLKKLEVLNAEKAPASPKITAGRDAILNNVGGISGSTFNIKTS